MAMSEDDWLTSGNSLAMVRFIRDERTPFRTRWLSWASAKRFSVSERKWRLIASAVFRSVGDLFPDEQAQQVLPILAQWADEEISHKDVVKAIKPVTTLLRSITRSVATGSGAALQTVAGALRWYLHGDSNPSLVMAMASEARARFFRARGTNRLLSEPVTEAYVQAREASDAECTRQADLVRCILGNPFRPTRLEPTWLDAHDGAARRVAQAIYDDHAFADLPVLADALEDAGCTDDAVLSHCRAPGPHARGCWVVDLVLGKE
jgi:hypothetical protein